VIFRSIGDSPFISGFVGMANSNLVTPNGRYASLELFTKFFALNYTQKR
jgi:hypothetical protein